MTFTDHRSRAVAAAAAAPALLAMLTAIAATGCASRDPSVQDLERFDRNSAFSRSFEQSPEQACVAARRALLSQGYIVDESRGANVKGHKNFQPDSNRHAEITFTIACVADHSGSGGSHGSALYVSAVQDNFTRKKVSQSASVGVGPIGSVSLPFGSTDDSLVKVGSSTISDRGFYDRFFGLVASFAQSQPGAAGTVPPTDGNGTALAPPASAQPAATQPASAQSAATPPASAQPASPVDGTAPAATAASAAP